MFRHDFDILLANGWIRHHHHTRDEKKVSDAFWVVWFSWLVVLL